MANRRSKAIAQQNRRRLLWIGLVVVIIVGAVVWDLNNDPNARVYARCLEVIHEHPRIPNTAEYPEFSRETVEVRDLDNGGKILVFDTAALDPVSGQPTIENAYCIRYADGIVQVLLDSDLIEESNLADPNVLRPGVLPTE